MSTIDYDTERLLRDYFSGKLESDISGIRSTLSTLCQNDVGSRNSSDTYYLSTNYRFKAVQMERQVLSILRQMDRYDVEVLAAHYSLHHPYFTVYSEYFKNQTRVVLYMAKDLAEIDNLLKQKQTKRTAAIRDLRTKARDALRSAHLSFATIRKSTNDQ